MNYQPIIAVTTGNGLPDSPELYMEAIKGAGGMAEYVHPGARKKGLADHYDGFLIPGGKDLSPLRYNEKKLFEFDPEEERRTDFELFVLSEAARRKKAVLGICYGMQLINVYFRGTLYQDIQSQRTDSLDHRRGCHGIKVERNPFFAEGDYKVNTSHHQALKSSGRDLIPFAFSPDGLVEAFFCQSHPFFVGVQWHPERMDNEISRLIFRSFVEACYEHK